MHDTSLVDLEVNLTLLHFTDSLGYIHSYSSTLGVWHQATRTEHTTQRTNLTHDGGHRDDDVDISPTTLNLLDVLIETYIVSTCFLSSSFSIWCAEAEHASHFTRSVGQRHDATNHLVCLSGVNAQTHIDINRSVKLGGGNLLHQGSSFFQGVCLPCFNLISYQLLILCQFTHFN